MKSYESISKMISRFTNDTPSNRPSIVVLRIQ